MIPEPPPIAYYMPRWADLDPAIRLPIELAMRDAHLTDEQRKAMLNSLIQQDAMRRREHDAWLYAKRNSRRGLARILNLGQ